MQEEAATAAAAAAAAAAGADLRLLQQDLDLRQGEARHRRCALLLLLRAPACDAASRSLLLPSDASPLPPPSTAGGSSLGVCNKTCHKPLPKYSCHHANGTTPGGPGTFSCVLLLPLLLELLR